MLGDVRGRVPQPQDPIVVLWITSIFGCSTYYYRPDRMLARPHGEIHFQFREMKILGILRTCFEIGRSQWNFLY